MTPGHATDLSWPSDSHPYSLLQVLIVGIELQTVCTILCLLQASLVQLFLQGLCVLELLREPALAILPCICRGDE